MNSALLRSHKNIITNEITIHRQLKHSNIVRFIESFMDTNNIYIVQSYCENKSLKEYAKGRIISKGECQNIMSQLFSGIEYMHKMNVIHRDLKTANILLDERYQVKIADFGLAIFTTNTAELYHLCGTTNYLAPELYRRKPFTFASDIWAAGVVRILFALLC